METNAESEDDPNKIKVEFNYEFLDDKICSKTEGQTQDKEDKNSCSKFFKECKKQWKIEEHPLALMVSYL